MFHHAVLPGYTCCCMRLSSSRFFVSGYWMNEWDWWNWSIFWLFFARGAQWPGAKHCGSRRSPRLHGSELLWTESDRLGPVVAIVLTGRGWDRNDRKIVKKDTETKVLRRSGRNNSKLLDKLNCIDWQRSVTEAEVWIEWCIAEIAYKQQFMRWKAEWQQTWNRTATAHPILAVADHDRHQV